MKDYRELIDDTDPTATILRPSLVPSILGGPKFLAGLPRRVRLRLSLPKSHPSLDQIVAYVGVLHGLTAEQIMSRRRNRRLVIARAQIAWYGIERADTNFSEIGKHLHRDGTTLSRMVDRYQRLYPKLFTDQTFASLTAQSGTPPSCGYPNGPKVTKANAARVLRTLYGQQAPT